MKKWCVLLLLYVVWWIIGWYCFAPSAATGPHTMPGVRSTPQRIVSLAPNLTEILFSLGFNEEIVGVSQYSDFPTGALAKPKIGSFWQPNLEAIIACAPDLVLTLGFSQQMQMQNRLHRLQVNCQALHIESVEDLLRAVRHIGDLTGHTDQAAHLYDQMKKRLAEITVQTNAQPRPRVLWVVQRDPLRVAGRQSLTHELIELAGGSNAMGPTVHKYPPISSEQVLACRPDVIIEQSMSQGNLAEQQTQARVYWRRFDGVPAVSRQRIYVIASDEVSRLGPRICDGIETVARCLQGVQVAEGASCRGF